MSKLVDVVNDYYFKGFLLLGIELLRACYLFYQFLQNNSVVVLRVLWGDIKVICACQDGDGDLGG